jgi:hypothetical protein
MCIGSFSLPYAFLVCSGMPLAAAAASVVTPPFNCHARLRSVGLSGRQATEDKGKKKRKEKKGVREGKKQQRMLALLIHTNQTG